MKRLCVALARDIYEALTKMHIFLLFFPANHIVSPASKAWLETPALMGPRRPKRSKLKGQPYLGCSCCITIRQWSSIIKRSLKYQLPFWASITAYPAFPDSMLIKSYRPEGDINKVNNKAARTAIKTHSIHMLKNTLTDTYTNAHSLPPPTLQPHTLPVSLSLRWPWLSVTASHLDRGDAIIICDVCWCNQRRSTHH